jgi:hypothetical protein
VARLPSLLGYPYYCCEVVKMDKEEVISLMESSKSDNEWNDNCDKVKEAFGGDGIGGAVRSGNADTARSYTKFVNRLVDEIDNLTGGAYRPALDAYAGPSALRDAAELGQEIVRKRLGADGVSRVMKQFSTKSELDLFRQGYKAALMKETASYPRSGDAAYAKILNNDAKVAEIRAVFGPQQADEILRAATVRQAQAGTYKQMGGSQTQQRQMAEQDLENSIQNGINLVQASTQPRQFLLQRATEWLSSAPTRAMSEKVRNKLAEQLFSPDPQKVQTALQAVQGAAAQFLKRNKAQVSRMMRAGVLGANVGQMGNVSSGVGAGIGAMQQGMTGRDNEVQRDANGRIVLDVYPAGDPRNRR